MGIGWVNENNEELRFQASATLWPSSTKAEMLACLTALITSPRYAKVTIHTDSKATIDGFQRLPEVSRLSIRKREKITNYPLWCMISYIIAQLDLEVIMKKVKAHSGDRLNDLADELAKNAVIHSPRLIFNLTLIPTLRMIMTCDNLHIEMSSRKCLKHLSHANNFYQFLLLRRSTDLLLLSEQHCIQWTITTRMLNSNYTDNDRATTSFTQHRRRAFKFKLLMQELPTLTQMHQRRPDLYRTTTCILCCKEAESQDHVWTCLVHQHTWINILDKAAHLLLSEVLKHNDKPPPIDAFLTMIHESRNFITHGLVPSYFWTSLTKIVKSNQHALEVCVIIYNYIYKAMFEDIWIRRCHAVISYELAQGITNKQKRSKHKVLYRHRADNTSELQRNDSIGITAPSPWITWYTSSIRKGLKWIDHLFDDQENNLRSLNSIDLNRFTTPSLFPNRNRLNSLHLTV